MKNNLVSILMPVYNSYGHVRSEGRNLIKIAIDSLLAQSYKDFELIILDNQSTDETPTVCKEYAKHDKRIRYIRDVKKRFPEGAITHLASFATGKYCMTANDDDIWEVDYIATLMHEMKNDETIDLCYGNGYYVDLNGNKVNKFVADINHAYDQNEDHIQHTLKYLHYRNVIPIAFGIYKTKSFQETLPFKKFDDLKANVDNLFMTKFMISGHKIKFVNKDIFSYRVKTRALDPSKVPGMPDLNHPLDIWYYYSIHQLTFCSEMVSIFSKYTKNENVNIYLTVNAIASCTNNIVALLKWIIKDVANNESNKKLLTSIHDALQPASVIDPIIKFEKRQISSRSVLLQSQISTTQVVIEAIITYIKKYQTKSVRKDLYTNLLNLCYDYCKYLQQQSNISRTQGKKYLQPTPKKQKSSDKPKISIIVTSYNLKSFLKQTLISILGQSYNNYEIIVIDGASTDGSQKVIQEMANQYPQVQYLSEPDMGYPDAFWKGVRKARGEYILQCATSDVLASSNWLSICAKTLDENKNISLVWGFPRSMQENGTITDISYPQFHHILAPEGKDYFFYWLRTGFYFPEGNLCVRKIVLVECYPQLCEIDKSTLDWLEFSYRFNQQGYLSTHIPIVANYGRTHESQMGKSLTTSGALTAMNKKYMNKVRRYQFGYLFELNKHSFRDGKGQIISNMGISQLELTTLRNEYLRKNVRYLIDTIYSRIIPVIRKIIK